MYPGTMGLILVFIWRIILSKINLYQIFGKSEQISYKKLGRNFYREKSYQLKSSRGKVSFVYLRKKIEKLNYLIT